MHKVNPKLVLGSIGLIGLAGGIAGWARVSPTKGFSKTVAGITVHLVAVTDTGYTGRVRFADHAWYPDGRPYDGPESRLEPRNYMVAPPGGARRSLIFELERLEVSEKATPADVYAYLPNSGFTMGNHAENPASAGPIAVQLWHVNPTDTSGTHVLPQPTSVVLEYGVKRAEPQPVVIGLAQGDYTVVAKGAASVTAVAQGHSAIVANGGWGRIEVTHLPLHPMVEDSRYSHQFQLLGGEYPPKVERRAVLYDAKGRVIAQCGDGPNNPGYAGGRYLGGIGPAEIVRFEIQERPYSFTQFDDVKFAAPKVKGVSGEQGLASEVDSAAGKVVGLLKSTKDGPWMGYVLYDAGGNRWLDPGHEMESYEFGMFDPWNHPLDNRWNIMLKPSSGLLGASSATKCTLYAADSPTGPEKEELSSWESLPYQAPISYFACNPTSRPYVLIELKMSSVDWRTIATIPVDDRMRDRAERGSPGTRVLEVFFDDDAGIRIWKDEDNPVRLRSAWRPWNQSIRAIAHLKDGSVVDASNNMSGYGGPPSNIRRYKGIEYDRQSYGTTVMSGAKNIDMKLIASFEIQVRDLDTTVKIPVHSPVD